MSAAYLHSSHDNTIPIKQPLKITPELTQQATGEHKPSVSPSFLTRKSSALWGSVPLFGPPWSTLVVGMWRRWRVWNAASHFWGSARVWRNCGWLMKRSNVIRTEDTFRSTWSRWQINMGKSTTSFFSLHPAHVAVHNTHPSNGEWLCSSAVLSIKDGAILTFPLDRLTRSGLHGAAISFYLNTFKILKVRFQNATSFHSETDSSVPNTQQSSHGCSCEDVVTLLLVSLG